MPSCEGAKLMEKVFKGSVGIKNWQRGLMD